MVRRLVAAIAVASVVLLAPTAAYAAYPAPGDALNCSATTVQTGATFTCTIGGPVGAIAVLQVTTSGADATIAGTTSSTKLIDATNVASYSITAPGTAGIIGVSALIDGTSVDTAVIQVVARGASLAATGSPIGTLAVTAALLLVGGAGFFAAGAARRRRVWESVN